MELSVAERILLLNLLPPAEGDFLFLRTIRTFRENLSFSEDEVADLEIKRVEGAVHWNPAKNPVKEIEISPSVAAYISRSIRGALSLHERYFDFYNRFVKDE